MPLKRVVAIGVTVFMAVLMIGSMADAGTGSISGTSISQCVCFSATGKVVSCSGTFAVKRCSIDVATLLKGLGNTFQGPNAVAALYDVQLFLQTGDVFCVNKPGNAEPANGQPFEGVIVEKVDVITNKEIDKNGKALSDLFFGDQEMLTAMGIPVEDLCPNKNWTALVFVQSLQALGRLLRDENQSPCQLDPVNGPINLNGCTVADALGVACTAPAGATVSAPFDYACATVCQDSAGVLCPDSPGEPPFPLP
jgi:hypothetical protein